MFRGEHRATIKVSMSEQITKEHVVPTEILGSFVLGAERLSMGAYHLPDPTGGAPAVTEVIEGGVVDYLQDGEGLQPGPSDRDRRLLPARRTRDDRYRGIYEEAWKALS